MEGWPPEGTLLSRANYGYAEMYVDTGSQGLTSLEYWTHQNPGHFVAAVRSDSGNRKQRMRAELNQILDVGMNLYNGTQTIT